MVNIFKSNIDNRYRYLYKITNKLTKQYYYGIHSTLNLNDGYMGSGVRILKDIKLIGIDNFYKEYIEFFYNDESLKIAEANILTIETLNDPLCYNVVSGGGKFHNYGIFPAKNIITGEIKAIKCGESYDKNIWVHITTGRKRISKNINGIIIYKYIYKEYLQKYLDEGWEIGLQKNVLGKIKINNGKKTKYIYKDDLQKYLDKGWVKGGLPIGCKGRIRIINSEKNVEKLIYKDDLQKYLDKGWKRGNLHKGRIHIYKNELHKMVFLHELNNYLSNGWIKGSNDHSILGKIKIIKNDKCLVINPDDLQKYLDDGWVKGSQPTTSGKIVVNKNNKNKFISPYDLQKYLDDGWIKGSKTKK